MADDPDRSAEDDDDGDVDAQLRALCDQTLIVRDRHTGDVLGVTTREAWAWCQARVRLMSD